MDLKEIESRLVEFKKGIKESGYKQGIAANLVEAIALYILKGKAQGKPSDTVPDGYVKISEFCKKYPIERTTLSALCREKFPNWRVVVNSKYYVDEVKTHNQLLNYSTKYRNKFKRYYCDPKKAI